MVSLDSIQALVAPQCAWLQEEILPPAIVFWDRLGVPEWDIYSDAFQECATDAIQAMQSTGHLLYLTFRPPAILFGIIFQFVGQLLLQKGWTSLQKGAIQAKVAIVWFYSFQRSLSRNEILGELGMLALVVSLYYLRKWLKQQTYFERAVQKLREKKHQAVKEYTKAVHRIAQVSFLLAMTLPHLIYFGAWIAFKLSFPSVVKWLAYDTYTSDLLSVWYPLIATLWWIHEQRHPERTHEEKGKSGRPALRELANTLDKAAPTAKKQRKKRRQPKPTSSQQSGKNATKSRNRYKDNESKVEQKPNAQLAESSTTYWLQYWGIYAIFQAFSQICSMVPVFGRLVARHPFFLSLAAELKLLFFVWIFFMEKLLGITTGDVFLAEALPLRLLHRHVVPFVLELDTVVSGVVTEETWNTVVQSKARRVVEVFVMLRFISEPFKECLLQILDEGRTLLLPAVTLLMPGFITQFGVVYVQYLVPSVKSSQSKGKAGELLYLQYWTLHCILSGFLAWFSPILWLVPFSTHAIFLAWCHLTIPRTISEYYEILEMELVTFGILKGDSVMAIHDTKTVQLLTAITRRLPSASEDEDDAYDLKEAESNMTDASNNLADVQGSVDNSIPVEGDNQIEASVLATDKQKADRRGFSNEEIGIDKNKEHELIEAKTSITQECEYSDSEVSLYNESDCGYSDSEFYGFQENDSQRPLRRSVRTKGR